MSATMLKLFRADLHIHSCLSPCADAQMRPRRIVEKSLDKNLDIIAVCDHNSAENAGAVMRLGATRGLTVLPGMEICSREEVHILAIFEHLEQTLTMQEYVYAHLPGTNTPEIFGGQTVMDENDAVVRENSRMLIMATQLRIDEIVERTHVLNGLSLASHIDRPAYGIIRKLGFIPPDLRLHGVEISRHMTIPEARKRMSGIDNVPCITCSDAHVPGDIGKAWTPFFMAAPRFEEIRLALAGRNGRRITV